MKDEAASSVEWLPGWQILFEFTTGDFNHSNRQLADEIAQIVQRLSLQPVQVERIHEAFVQAVNRTICKRTLPLSRCPIHVRIWVLETGAGRGWSFFMLEKQDADLPGAEPGHLVELFLYQEQESA
jgi:hypothetical protein